MTDHKQYLPEKQVRDRYGVSEMTLRRWDATPELGFPKPLRIRERKYRAVDELDAFDARQREAANG